jgi:putative addiction module CopG family antidote
MPSHADYDIGEHFKSFIDLQLAQGRYGSPSEVVHAALRLLERTRDQACRIAGSSQRGRSGSDRFPSGRCQ